MKELSERLFAEAAESFIRRAETQKNREIRKLEERLGLYEKDLTQKRKMWDEDKSSLLEKIQDMERDRAGLVAAEAVWNEKYHFVKKGKQCAFEFL